MWNVSGKGMQLTLALLKPELYIHPLKHQTVLWLLHANDFIFLKSKIVKLSRNDCEEFYTEHKERFFYQRLVEYMSSGPLTAHILAKNNAISDWRELLGPTKVFRTKHDLPQSVRGWFGITDTRNSAHGSDSTQSARQEIKLFFPDFPYDDWMSKHTATDQSEIRENHHQSEFRSMLRNVNIKPQDGATQTQG